MKRIEALALVALMAGAGAGCRNVFVRPTPATAEVKAIRFLTEEVPAWSRENGCFSCHNNGDASRALYFASGRGHRLPARALSDTTGWLRQPGRWEHNTGEPGFSDQRLANIQFAAALLAAIAAGQVRDNAPLQEAARKVAAGQDADGAWHIERQNPVGSPATYGTTLATFMAWRTLAASGANADATARAERWLLSLHPLDVPTAAVIILFSGIDRDRSLFEARRASLDFLRLTQTPGGGWGPYRDSPAESFDTALALLALADLPTDPSTAAMTRRGRAFLVNLQESDGGWPATTRPPGGASYAQRISTTGWALLALLQTVD